MLSDTNMLVGLAEIEAEEGDPALQVAARAVLDMKPSEHFPMHVSEAARALRHFGPGQRMEEIGKTASLSHADLIREGYVIFLCGPQALMQQLGPLYALHMGAFVQALFQKIGFLRVIADEFTNSPLKSLISQAITTCRSYGGELHLISQSKSEVLRKFGKNLTHTIEDNCPTKRWLAFGSHSDAEALSRAIGEEFALTTALGTSSGDAKTQTNLSLTKQRQISASELLSLPRDQQLIHIRGVGYFLCRRVVQNQIAPYCHHLAENLLEGGRLPPDPKITLTVPQRAA
jgi:type IV secretion system protein VirD4